MNKTAVTLGFFALGLVGLVGAIFVLIIKPEAIAQAVSLIVTVLGIASTAVVTFYALGKQGEKIDTIQKQTNGNLSKLQAENTRLTNLLADRGVNPTAEQINEQVVSGRHVL